MAIKNEICRFACEKTFGRAAVPHWRPISKDGIKALYDCGIVVTSATTGKRTEYSGDPSTLPYGHAGRLLQNRKPETMLFTRKTLDTAISVSLCGYNHISGEELEQTNTTLGYVQNEEIGIKFKNFLVGPVLNLSTLDTIRDEMISYIGNEYIGWGTHEQYFYPEYYAYQPDYKEKLLRACEVLKENNYEYIFIEDIL